MRARLFVSLLALCLTRPALAQPVLDGEVLIVPGDAEALEPDGRNFRVKNYQSVVKKVVAKLGDHFQTITVWLTFDDGGDLSGAFSRTVRNDVRGIGSALIDNSAQYGSQGVLRNLISMKGLGLRAGDTRDSWTNTLNVWGQEYVHRWAIFMTVRDPRTGNVSDMLLGRDCSHYNRFVETQGSVLDGYAWRENPDGTFTRGERAVRFAHLDLYAMGLLGADEVPPFFLIDGIPNFTHARCGAEYANTPFPREVTLPGTKVMLSMDDIVFANGHRAPNAGQPQDYWREAIVVLTGIGEPVDAQRPKALAARLNTARAWWDEWVRQATRQRMVNCTKITADCGDARADIAELTVAAQSWSPRAPMVSASVRVRNGGTLDTAAAKLSVEALVDGKRAAMAARDLGPLARGADTNATVPLTTAAACGAEVVVRAVVENEAHHSRRQTSVIVGAEARLSEGFEQEAGWTVNPDGTDSAAAGAWERAAPMRAELRNRFVQPAGARSGGFAFVTGADAKTYLSRGRTTLQSPPLDVAGLRGLRLRYAVSFAGGRLGTSALRFDPSPAAHLTVLARALDDGGQPMGDFVAIDKLSAALTDGWTSRVATIEGKVPPAARLQLRFVAADEVPEDGAVEAAIDDVEILASRPECLPDAGVAGTKKADAADDPECRGPNCPQDPPAGCACRLEGRGRPGAWVLLLALLALRRRR